MRRDGDGGGVALLLLAALALPRSAEAQRRPRDVATAAAEAPLPAAPEGYEARQVEGRRWEYPRQARSVAASLEGVLSREWPRIVEELGADGISEQLWIRIGRNPDEMAALAPARAPPPSYASGVAYPARGLILLTLTDPETAERPDVETVLAHELSHVALHRATGGHGTPLWFSEGVAIYQARERSFERARVLWSGTVGHRLMSFEELSTRFPSRPRGVSLAYAQSADFVSWLRARPDGHAKFRTVIRRLREGQSFETALERTYSASMTRLEIDWQESLSERFEALPLLFGSGAIWVFAALLILLAYARRRRKDRIKLGEWAEEESQAAAVVEVLLALEGERARTSAGPSPTAPGDEEEVLYVVPAEPRGLDPGVPTIEHEGRSHTLH